MILLKWAEGAVVVVEEEPAVEGAVDRAEAGYVVLPYGRTFLHIL